MAQATSGTEAQSDREGGVSGEMRGCIEICTECHRSCLETVQQCLRMGGKHADPEHIRLLLDCAEICETSADFMTRASPLHHLTCGACAEICRACADACRRLGDAAMKACADVCERCAESCARMAGHSRQAH
jgi:hypothetical protein